MKSSFKRRIFIAILSVAMTFVVFRSQAFSLLLSDLLFEGSERITVSQAEAMLRDHPENVDYVLYCAVTKNYLEIVRWLVEVQGADVQSIDENGWSLLHEAAQEGCLEVSEYLISKNVGINCRDVAGQTPLYCALIERQWCIAELLINHGADVNCQTNDGRTAPLHVAAYEGDLEIVRLLISKNANVNCRDSDGKTSLSIAMEENYDDIAELLLEHGAIE